MVLTISVLLDGDVFIDVEPPPAAPDVVDADAPPSPVLLT